jgi:hydrogen peroxide-dependent heme synthase
MASVNEAIEVVTSSLPAVPLTVEGAAILHQMMRVRWPEWKRLSPSNQRQLAAEFAAAVEPTEREGQSAVYSLLGHKGDLLVLHFRNSFDELNATELRLSQLGMEEFLEPVSSYLSVIELGLYESTVKLYRSLAEKGVEPHSAEWKRETDQVLERQREAMRPRLFPKIPGARYLCFYPMDRRRGEQKNWYSLPIEERQRQMEEHGKVGRRYVGAVQQIISGSIGFDNWEWGVDLFADDALIFKRLIYEMRFDEVSAVYAVFGPFYVGIRCPVTRLQELLGGALPSR